MADLGIRPNILLVHWHDLGRHLGAYGARGVESPNADRLAAEGLRFDRAFCAAPLSSPARGSLFTGRYPHANGLMGEAHHGWKYAPGERTLPVLLRSAGYHSALVGAQHESPDPETLGYDEVIASGNPLEVTPYCGSVAEAASSWLESAGMFRQPFLLVVGFHETHRPYPEELYPPDDPGRVHVPGFLPDNPSTRGDLAAFQGAIRTADAALGRLLDRVDALGLTDSTWVIFTTDHGMAFPRAKSTLYDPGIGVAMIMRLPDGWPRPEGVERRLFSHVDLVPTVLDRIGAEIPDTLQGMSHARWLDGDEATPRRTEVFAEKNVHDVYDPMRCVRTERWKYIRNYEERPLLTLPLDIEASPTRRGYGDDHLRYRPIEELYDLRDDPTERENIVDEASIADIRADLAGRLVRWRQETHDPLLYGPITPPAGPNPSAKALVTTAG